MSPSAGEVDAGAGGLRVGILGGGQLGRMLGLAGIPLGMRFRFLEPAPDPPAGAVGEVVAGAYDDLAALERLARDVDLVTYEFENVPAAATEWLVGHGVPVFPPPAALAVAQDRLAEKTTFRSLGIPTPDFRTVGSLEDLHAGVAALGVPAVLKTRRMGYDGKGQVLIRERAGVEAAWQELGARREVQGGETGPAELLLEAFVPFRRELSIVAARGRDGSLAFYPLVENVHRGGILVRTTAPAPDADGDLKDLAEGYIRALLQHLDYVGVLALELFQVRDGLLANEIAPRVHNTGHWTQDGAVTSQFENHLRAVAGWPLGSPAVTRPTVMLNLLGSAPPPETLLAEGAVHLHLYDKAPRPGRKIGHVNVCAPDPASAGTLAGGIEALLEG
jgi:5-(carboxyamino)imidazole ribonucleotide synthase